MAGIPQVITEDRASGAQFIDGSLKFDKSRNQYLKFTPTTTGNRRTWTFSCWFKRMEDTANRVIFSSYGSGATPWTAIQTTGNNDGRIQATFDAGISAGLYTDARFRDDGWYHLVWSVDTTQAADPHKSKVYINGVLQTYESGPHPSLNEETKFNLAGTTMYIGYTPNQLYDGHMSQCYFMDGQALPPEFFGYTDPLTGVWRPRGKLKKTVNDGTNFTADITNTGSTLNNPGRIFDGTIDSDATIASGAATILYTPSTPIKYADSVRVMGSGSPSSPYNARWQLNGGSNVSAVNSNTFVTLDSGNGGGTITSIRLTVDSGGANWRAIEVDGVIMKANAVESVKFGRNGFYLPMDGNSPIGQDQVPSPNDGTIWSSGWSGTNMSGYNKEESFDGITNTNGNNATRVEVNQTLTWTNPKTSTPFTTLRLWAADDTGTIRVNGVDVSGQIGAGYAGVQFFTITGVGSALETIELVGGSGIAPFLWAVEIDGTILIDGQIGNSWTPVGFGGSNTIEKATGALPILNTDGGGNTARPGTRNDAYASDIVMAIPFLGNTNDISANIRGSGSNLSVTTSGSPAADSNPTQWYGSSFNVSTNNYIDTIGTTTTFAFLHQPEAAGTIEGWVNTNAVNVQGPWFQTSNGTDQVGVMFRQNSNTNLAVQINRGVSGQAIVVDSSVTVALNTWHHWAFVKSADGYAQFFLDGVPTGSKVPISTAAGASNAASTNTSSSFAGRIARNHGETRGVGANISDYRAYTIQKYAFDTPFIPASTNPDILPDTPSGVSGKSKLTKITDGAVYFDGSSEQHMDAGSALINTNTSFCVEAFAYLLNNPTSSDMGMICSQYASGTPAGRMLYGFQDGYLALRINGTTVQLQSAAGSVGPNSWYHTAWTWDGTTHRLFLDGKLVDSSTTVPAPYTGTNTEIGGNAALNAYDIKGYISNFRIVTGSAVYTGDFTPPTEKLTNITNTSLLCCQSNTQPGAAVVGPRVSGVNNGTGWSSSLTSDSLFRSGFPGWKAFNGTTKSSTNDCAATPQTAGQGFTFTFGGGVPFTTLQMQCDPNGSGGATVKANGVDITSQLTNGSLTNTTITGVTSPLTSLSLVSRSGDAGYLGSVTIDGTMLVDPIIRNTSTIVATNFNPLTDDINAIRGQETSYATFNRLDHRRLTNGPTYTLSNGNLTCDMVGGTNHASGSRGFAASTLEIPSGGKWYCEFYMDSLGNDDIALGIASDIVLGYYIAGGNPKPGAYMVRSSGIVYSPTFQLGSDSARAFTSNDLVGVSVDLESTDKRITFYKNGFAVYNTTVDETEGPFKFVIGCDPGGSTAYKVTANFGQKPFRYIPPDGFQPLSLSTVRPEKVFARPEQYIGVTLFTGTGDNVSSRTVELPHAADLVWAKSRDRNSSHQLADTVRGNGSVLQSNSQMTARNPITQYTGGGISTIDGKTITIASGTTNNQNLNVNGNRGVVWSWKAGGSTGTFNVDDVGYANASDVNMNVGAFDSSTFLKGQVWSGLLSPASGAFDQDASNAFNGFLSASTRLRTSGNQVLVTMNLSSTPVTVSSQIKVHAETGYNSTCTVTVGGTTYTSSTGSIHTFNVSGSLTQMTVVNNGSGGRTYLEGMEVDGKLLVDDNLTVNAPSIANTGCSVGTKQGFSIIKYDATGSNLRVSHGLSERPGLILLKSAHGTTGDWLVWHQSLAGVDRFLKLNETITQAQADNVFLSIDENTFGTGDDSGINSNGQQKIAYLWHDVPGLQKFGKWTNNNSNNGTFIELGFRPALILLKNTDNVEKWYWIDSTRHPYNEGAPSNNAAGAVNTLQPNTGNTEATSRGSHTNTTVDILSNGFKIYTTNPASGEISFGTRNYIYAAWAEAPNINLYGAQANAR